MTRPTKRTAGPVIVAAAGLIALAGCGSGLDAQTYDYRAQYGSSDADAGLLTVRNVFVAAPGDEGYAQGASADVVLSLASRADGPDRLVSATSRDATSVEVPDGLTVTPGRLELDKRITLLGLKRPLRGSDYVDVDLSFESGASVSIKVPVAVTDDPPAENPDFEIPETDSVGNPLVEHGEDEEHGSGEEPVEGADPEAGNDPAEGTEPAEGEEPADGQEPGTDPSGPRGIGGVGGNN